MTAELSLAGKGLKELPPEVGQKFGATLLKLDLTENDISTGKNFETLAKLETLVLDKNHLDSLEGFPAMPTVKTLWLNNNNISDSNAIVEQIKAAFPNLTYLSVLMNPAAPNIYLDDGAAEAYQRFRHMFIHKLPKLEFLDSTPILAEEQKEAHRVGAFLNVAKPKGSKDAHASEEEVEAMEKARKQHFAEAAPKAATFLAKGKPRYDGSNSEGNRFICNDDL